MLTESYKLNGSIVYLCGNCKQELGTVSELLDLGSACNFCGEPVGITLKEAERLRRMEEVS